MKAIFDPRQWHHDPKHFMANGAIRPNPEQPRRIEVLKSAAEEAGCDFQAPADAGLGPIAAVHTPEYLTFLETIHTRWRRIEGAGEGQGWQRVRPASLPTLMRKVWRLASDVTPSA